LGLLAISLDSTPGVRLENDGTTIAFLIFTLSVISLFASASDDARLEQFAAVCGASAFGYFLFVPARFAFDDLGTLDTGAWLGLCTVVIPVGILVAWAADRRAAPSAAPSGAGTGSPFLLAATLGIVLVVIGIWLDAAKGGVSYWSLSHTLGILMLLLAAVSGLLLYVAEHRDSRMVDAALVFGAITFGLAEFVFVQAAFNELGTVGAGGWLEAVGGLLLIVGAYALRKGATRQAAVVAQPAPA
jgi:hypothetical protein